MRHGQACCRSTATRSAARLVKKYAAKRAALLSIINDQKATDEDRDEARAKLQKLPRDASPGAPAQSLRADRPAARHVPQIRPRRATSCARSRCAARFPA